MYIFRGMCCMRIHIPFNYFSLRALAGPGCQCGKREDLFAGNLNLANSWLWQVCHMSLERFSQAALARSCQYAPGPYAHVWQRAGLPLSGEALTAMSRLTYVQNSRQNIKLALVCFRCSNITWSSRRLKSLRFRAFVTELVHANNKTDIKD